MRKVCFILIYLCIITWAYPLLSADADKVDYKKLFKSAVNKEAFEVGEIKFTGNTFFNIELLENILNSKRTSRSIPYSIFEFAYSKSVNNILVPAFVKRNIESNLNTFAENDIHYFTEDAAELDLMILRQYYAQYGFHEAQVDYRFFAKPKDYINVLKFYIIEGERYKIDSLIYLGLDSLDTESQKKISEMRAIKSDDNFSELAIFSEVSSIYSMLRNNGYYYANYDQPQVIINTETKKNTITINFNPGIRQKIGTIKVIDSLSGQKALASSMVKEQFEIKVGDYFSQQKVSSSESNLFSLGIFESIKIDTVNSSPTDSVINLSVLLRYRKQQDYGFSGFLNRTVIDKTLNAGVELSYSHKNIFGSAQVFNPFARFVILDVSRAIYNISDAEFEYQFGFNLSQPSLWTFGAARIGISSQIMYSLRSIYNDLKLSTFTFPVKFPIRLSKRTFFNSASIEFSFDRQVPENYDDAINKAFQSATNAKDSVDILTKFMQFTSLNDYVKYENPLLTSTLIGATINGDSRDNPFAPTQGNYTTVSVDGSPIPVNSITGVSNFARIQIDYAGYRSLNNQTVLAFKIKGGHIFWFDRENSFIPYERQFFCGGANSVRGWPSRRLRYYGTSLKDYNLNEYFDFAQDFIGNTSMLEGSLELRYRLAAPGSSDYIKQLLRNVELAFFVDFGNAYQWFLFQDDKDYTVSLKAIDYLKGIAAACGIGIRYETQIGMIRLDFGWKLYDPNSQINPELFSKSSSLDQFQFHIGLGNPF